MSACSSFPVRIMVVHKNHFLNCILCRDACLYSQPRENFPPAITPFPLFCKSVQRIDKILSDKLFSKTCRSTATASSEYMAAEKSRPQHNFLLCHGRLTVLKIYSIIYLIPKIQKFLYLRRDPTLSPCQQNFRRKVSIADLT